MPKLATKADLQRLIADEIQESLTLDYKASQSLAKDGKAPGELCKDVSAFANAAGGQIIYGIEEKDRKPIKIDGGSDVTREWVEQVIDSNVQPRIEGLVITPIPVGGGRHAYVLTIPQALARAPHQAPDNKYYKRQNFQSVPMEDYEVRDAFRRATTPELHVDLAFANGNTTSVNFNSYSDVSDPILVFATVTNRSPQPADYAIVKIGIDAELKPRPLTPGLNERGVTGTSERRRLAWFGYRFSPPAHLPIFKEMDASAGHHQLQLSINYPSRLVRASVLSLATSVQTPGYSAEEEWFIRAEGGDLQIIQSRSGE